MISYKLYAVTDRSWLKEGETLADAVSQAILGGVTFVQFREKEWKNESSITALKEGEGLDSELVELARSVQAVCRAYHVPFVINDNVELAKEIDADGVHLGLSDMAIQKARVLLGPDKIIGATAKTIEQAKMAQQAGANYLGSGAIFGTTTKKDAKPMTKELLQKICESVEIPVVAIGGIDAENVADLRGLPISGVAVVSGIFAKKNKRRAAREIREQLYGAPIIQCITNHVTVNPVANLILSSYGSPIMAHHPKEVEEVQKSAKALLLNLGATDDYEAMKLAYQTALKEKHVVVIDPVGVSGITFRRAFLMELLELGSPTCIRGNYAEIAAIAKNVSTGAGLDGIDGALSTDEMEAVCGKLAAKLDCIVVASGKTDFISDGTAHFRLREGHPMQKKLTGSGCMLSAAICTELALLEENRSKIKTVVQVCLRFEEAAKRAAEDVALEEKGIYSFQTRFFDYLGTVLS